MPKTKALSTIASVMVLAGVNLCILFFSILSIKIIKGSCFALYHKDINYIILTPGSLRDTFMFMESGLERNELVLCVAMHFNDGKAYEGHHPTESGFVLGAYNYPEIQSVISAIVDVSGGKHHVLSNYLDFPKRIKGYITGGGHFIGRETSLLKARPDAQEFILCASNHYDDKIKHDKIISVETGFVVSAQRHCNIISSVDALVSACGGDYDKISKLNINAGITEGFLTNKNRFVDREEGYDIALNAGQIHKKPMCILFSEDLY